MANARGSGAPSGNRLVNNEEAVSSTSARPEQLDAAIRRCCVCKSSVQGKPSKLLACLHTVCAPCNISHTNGGEFTCSICSCKSASTSIVENFVAHGLDANDKPVIRCSNKELCPEPNSIAKFRCTECSDYLCTKCKAAHLLVKLTRDHHLVAITDSRAQPGISPMCQKHPHEELTLYCKKCDILTCRDCQLSQEHNGHHQEHMTVNEAAGTKRNQLLMFAQRAQSKIQSVQDHHTTAVRRLEEVDQLRETLKRELRHAAESLHSILKTRIKHLGDTIDQTCDQQRQAYLDVKDPLERIGEMGKQAAYFAMAAGSLNDKYALLHSLQYVHSQRTLINSLRNAFDTDILTKPITPTSLQLPTKELCDSIANFGKLVFGPGDPQSNSHQTNGHERGNTPASVTTPTVERQQPPEHLQSKLRTMLDSGTSPYALVDQILPPSGQQQVQMNIRPSGAAASSGLRQYVPQNQARPPGQQPPPNVSIQHQQLLQQQLQQHQQLQHQQQMAFARMNMGHQQQHQQHQQQQQPPQRRTSSSNMVAVSAAYGQPNRHNSPVASSPNGVSSTSVTPPHSHFVNPHMGYGSDHNGHISYQQHPASHLPPPPLYSSINPPSSIGIPVMQPLQPRPPQLFHDPNAGHFVSVSQLRIAGQPQIYQVVSQPRQCNPMVAGSGNTTTRLVVSSQYQQQSQRMVAAAGQAQSNGSGAMSTFQPAAGSRAQISGDVRPKSNHAVSCQRGEPFNNSSHHTPSNISTDTTSRPPAPSIVKVTSIPDVVDNADNWTQQLDPSDFATAASTVSTPKEKSEPGPKSQAGSLPSHESRVQPADTPPTPVAKVTSTTVDGENSQSDIISTNPSGQMSGNSSMARLRLSAKKSIASRPSADSTCEISAKPSASSDVTLPPVLASDNDLDQDSFNLNVGHDIDDSMQNLFNSSDDPGPIETPPLAEDVDLAERQTPDAEKVTTSDANAEELDEAKPEEIMERESRSWDDWCAVCNNGGTLVCCEGPGCKRVFHHDHHIPALEEDPEDGWQCTFCTDLEKLKLPADNIPRNERTHMTLYESAVCQRILLSLYTHAESVAFQEPVDEMLTEYFEVIDHPMDFSSIKKRLSPGSKNHYRNVMEFVRDLNQVFLNCNKFNTEDRDPQLRNAGVIVGQEYLNLMKIYLPDLVGAVKLNNSSPKKRQRASRSSSNESSRSSTRKRRVYVEEDDENS